MPSLAPPSRFSTPTPAPVPRSPPASSGTFSASGLRAGDSYTVNVTAPGYASAQVTDVVTVLAQSYDLPIDLAAEGDAIVVTASRLKGAGTISQGPATVTVKDTDGLFETSGCQDWVKQS